MTLPSENHNNAGRAARSPALSAAVMEGLAFCSAVFWGPDPAQCRAMHGGDSLAFLEKDSLLWTFEWCRNACRDIEAVVHAHAHGDALFQALEERYVSLFISNRQGIDAPLYHSCYPGDDALGSRPLLMGAPALEMQKRLTDSGLAMTEGMNHPSDHLCIEIEYLYFLLQGEAGRDTGEERTESAVFAEWMLSWAARFNQRLGKADPGGFYCHASGLLVNLLKATMNAG